jgi:hypothetical protein
MEPNNPISTQPVQSSQIQNPILKEVLFVIFWIILFSSIGGFINEEVFLGLALVVIAPIFIASIYRMFYKDKQDVLKRKRGTTLIIATMLLALSTLFFGHEFWLLIISWILIFGTGLFYYHSFAKGAVITQENGEIIHQANFQDGLSKIPTYCKYGFYLGLLYVLGTIAYVYIDAYFKNELGGDIAESGLMLMFIPVIFCIFLVITIFHSLYYGYTTKNWKMAIEYIVTFIIMSASVTIIGVGALFILTEVVLK